jgi:hypothetical protein
VDGADVDDAPAAALGDHLLGGELRAEEGALEVDRQHLLVLVLRGVEHRGPRLHAGVVDHHVETAEVLDRPVDQPLEVGDLAHVGLDTGRLVAERLDLVLELFSGVLLRHVVDDDVGLAPGERQRDRLADPAVAPGDDGNLSLE